MDFILKELKLFKQHLVSAFIIFLPFIFQILQFVEFFEERASLFFYVFNLFEEFLERWIGPEGYQRKYYEDDN